MRGEALMSQIRSTQCEVRIYLEEIKKAVAYQAKNTLTFVWLLIFSDSQ